MADTFQELHFHLFCLLFIIDAVSSATYKICSTENIIELTIVPFSIKGYLYRYETMLIINKFYFRRDFSCLAHMS